MIVIPAWNPRDVRCPRCGSAPGWTCVTNVRTQTGGGTSHAERRQSAFYRAYQEGRRNRDLPHGGVYLG